MADQPTVGLGVDLTEIIAAKAEYSATKQVIADIGTQADQTSQRLQYLVNVEIQSAKMADAARAASAKAASDMASQAASQQASIDANYLKIRMANTQAEVNDFMASQRAMTAFKAAMSTQRAAQDAAETKAAIAVASALANGLAAVKPALESHTGALINGRVAAEAFAVAHEAMQGRLSRIPGTLFVLGNALSGAQGNTSLLTAAFSPLGLAIIATTAIVGTFLVALDQGAEEQAKLQNSLDLTGHYAGSSAAAISDAADQIAASTHSSAGAAEAAFETIVASGHVGGAALDSVGDAAVRLSELTGQSASKIAAEWASMADNPVEAMNRLQNQYHFLTDEQYRHIQALSDEGDKTQAVQALFGDFNTALSEQTRQFGFLEGAIHAAHQALNDLWDGLKNFGKTASDQTTVLSSAQEVNRDAVQLQSVMPSQRRAAIEANQQAAFDRMHAAQADMLTQQTQAAAAAQHQQTIDADNALSARLTGLRDNHEKALAEMKQYRDQANQILGDPTASPQARSEAQFSLSHESLLDAQITRKYASDKMPGAHTPSMAGAINSISVMQAAVADLRTQIDSVSANPLSQIAAEIVKAGDAAAAHRTAGTGSLFQDQAQQLAEQKEAETLTLQMVQAQAKQTQTQLDANTATQASIDVNRTSNSIMLAFWTSGSQTAEGYAAALEQVHQAQLASQESAAALKIAHDQGATSISNIGAAYLASLPAAMQTTTWAQQEAVNRQAAAQATYNAIAAGILLNDQKERENELDAHQVQVAETVAEVNAHTTAVQGGTAALVEYNRNLAIQAEITANKGIDPLQAAANVDAQTISTSKLKTQQEDLTRLTQEGSAAREAEGLATDIMALKVAELLQTQKSLTDADKERLTTQSQIEAVIQQQIIDTQKLEQSIQDSIRDAFINTGKLDFSSLQKGLEQTFNKAIYDAFLAKPIDIVVNAVVDFEKQALDNLLKSITGPNSPLSGLASLFGGQQYSSATDAIMQSLGAPAQQLSSAASMLSKLGTAATSALIAGPIGSGIVGLLGGNSAQQANAGTGAAIGAGIGSLILPGIGTIIGGILGAIGGALVGTGTQDAQTAVLLNAAGGIVGPISGKHQTAATDQAVDTISSNLQQLITQLGALGVNAQGIIGGIDTHQLGPNDIFVNPTSSYVKTAQGDSQALTDAITKALLQYATISNTQEKALVDQMVAANDNFQDIVTALQNFQAAQQQVTDIHTALLKYTNPALAATTTLQATQIARRQTIVADINAGYFTPDQIAQIAQELPQLEQKEIQDALSGVATAAGGAAHSLQDFITAQQKVVDFVNGLDASALSPLSPQAQMDAATAIFNGQVAQAKGGNYDALTGLTGNAQTYLQQAQKFLGSGTSYNDLYQQVKSALMDVGTSSPTIADPQVQAIDDASQALQDAINAGSLNIVSAITGANSNVATGGSSMTQAQVDQITQSVAAAAEAQAAATAAGFSSVADAASFFLAAQAAAQGGLAA